MKELDDNDGNKCSRYIINLNFIEDVDVLVTTNNLDFEDVISLVLYDEELELDLF